MLFNYKVDIISSCLEDLEQYVENTSKYSISLSQKIKDEFYSKIPNLQEYPQMYPVFKIIDNVKIRKIVIQKYVILYTLNNKQITILNIYPQKSNYINLIKI